MQASEALKLGLLLWLAESSVHAVQLAGTSEAERTEWGMCSGITSTNFTDYMVRFGKNYEPESDEYSKRKGLYSARLAHMAWHNCYSGLDWEQGVNQFMDWTEEELLRLRGYKRTSWSSRQPSTLVANRKGVHLSVDVPDAGNLSDVPAKVTWYHLESIKEPRDQAYCGSCWAYAAETVMRAHAEIKNRSHRFAVNQIVACTPNPRECGGQGGCAGATVELAYEYVLKAGVEYESGWNAPADAECPELKRVTSDLNTKVVTMADGREVHTLIPDSGMRGPLIGMTGFTKLPENKELPIVQALVQQGPVAVAVSTGNEWHFYSKGVLTAQGCDKDNVISHAVVLFGYGIARSKAGSDVKYWHLKNSWGDWWGERGNMRLQRVENEEKFCGWDKKPEVGSGCKGGPPQVWVCGSCGLFYDAAVPHFM